MDSLNYGHSKKSLGFSLRNSTNPLDDSDNAYEYNDSECVPALDETHQTAHNDTYNNDDYNYNVDEQIQLKLCLEENFGNNFFESAFPSSNIISVDSDDSSSETALTDVEGFVDPLETGFLHKKCSQNYYNACEPCTLLHAFHTICQPNFGSNSASKARLATGKGFQANSSVSWKSTNDTSADEKVKKFQKEFLSRCEDDTEMMPWRTQKGIVAQNFSRLNDKLKEQGLAKPFKFMKSKLSFESDSAIDDWYFVRKNYLSWEKSFFFHPGHFATVLTAFLKWNYEACLSDPGSMMEYIDRKEKPASLRKCVSMRKLIKWTCPLIETTKLQSLDLEPEKDISALECFDFSISINSEKKRTSQSKKHVHFSETVEICNYPTRDIVDYLSYYRDKSSNMSKSFICSQYDTYTVIRITKLSWAKGRIEEFNNSYEAFLRSQGIDLHNSIVVNDMDEYIDTDVEEFGDSGSSGDSQDSGYFIDSEKSLKLNQLYSISELTFNWHDLVAKHVKHSTYHQQPLKSCLKASNKPWNSQAEGNQTRKSEIHKNYNKPQSFTSATKSADAFPSSLKRVAKLLGYVPEYPIIVNPSKKGLRYCRNYLSLLRYSVLNKCINYYTHPPQLTAYAPTIRYRTRKCHSGNRNRNGNGNGKSGGNGDGNRGRSSRYDDDFDTTDTVTTRFDAKSDMCRFSVEVSHESVATREWQVQLGQDAIF